MLVQEVRKQLLELLGPERYRDDKEALVTHSYDATPMLQSLPDAVVYPETTAEVQHILRAANEYRIPIVPRGAASNLCGGTVPVEGGIVVAMTRMNKLLELDTDNLTATFQPGLNTKQFHREVEKRGLFYPPDPSSMVISTLGGNIMEGAGGLRGLKYGTTKDYVLGLEAVLPSGEVIRTGGKLYKDVAGYDLTKLLVGSEGTLALITEATVKLLPAPLVRQTMLVAYSDIYAAARSVSRIVGARIIPATLEIMDQPTIRVVEEYNHIGLPIDMEAVLLIEQDGQELDSVRNDMEAIAAICAEEGASRIQTAKDEAEAGQLMKARRSALSTLARISPTTILEDATVPRSRIADMMLAINRIADEYGVKICTFGHAGDGNLHPTCPTDARNADEIHRVEEAFAAIFEEAIRLGGTITGEHGVGTVKAPYLEWKVGAAGIDLMKGIKQAFDPNGIMNPSKIFAKSTRKRLVISR
ncbi:FAD-binding oxidoreductase [Paenibacillus marinisediminis]